jgi:integrase
MAIPVYIEKRLLNERRRNGTRKVRYVLRWEDPETGKRCCESTATSDRTQAEELQKLKWAEVNGLLPAAEPEPQPEVPRPTWDECREALQRAMEADRKRRATVSDYLTMFDGIRRAFPETASPADITPEMANEYKRRRGEDARGLSAWTIRGDLSTLKAIFGNWLGKECGLLDPAANPFANVKPPECDEPEVRIVTLKERAECYKWFSRRWNNWQLPLVYLDVADATGWRATEIASMRADDVLDDGFVRVLAESSKTRRRKHGCLSPTLHAELQACAAGGWAFGRFSDELRRRLILWKKRPHHAAKVKDFTPERLVGWMQDELQRFNDEKVKAAKEANPPETWERFSLHDFRKTTITALQMSGTSEKETSVLVGATPEVIRRHYEKMDQQGIARRALERRLMIAGEQSPRTPRAGSARAENGSIDSEGNQAKVITA